MKKHISSLWDNCLEKTLYFANLLTKRENLSHSEAKFISRFLLCMKWAWQASVDTPFLKIWKEAHHIISRPISRFCDKFYLISHHSRGKGSSTLIVHRVHIAMDTQNKVLYYSHSALQEDTGFSIVTQETDDIFKIFKQIHDWKS